MGIAREEGGDKSVSEATVKLRVGNKTHYAVAEGNGPISALDHALRKALEKDFPSISEIRLVDFKVLILESNLGRRRDHTSAR